MTACGKRNRVSANLILDGLREGSEFRRESLIEVHDERHSSI
jgi:hypothetical protein